MIYIAFCEGLADIALALLRDPRVDRHICGRSAIVLRWEWPWRNLSGQAEFDSKPRTKCGRFMDNALGRFLSLVGGLV